MRISDWSSDVCSSDLSGQAQQSFTDDVALDLRRAAGDGFGKHVEIVVSPAVHADDFRRADAVEVDGRSGDALRELGARQADQPAAGVGPRVLPVKREFVVESGTASVWGRVW